MFRVVVGRRTFLQQLIFFLIPIAPLRSKRSQKAKRRLQIDTAFPALFLLCNLNKPAGADGGGGGVFQPAVLRLPEIYRNQIALRNIGDKVVGDSLGGVEILSVIRV